MSAIVDRRHLHIRGCILHYVLILFCLAEVVPMSPGARHFRVGLAANVCIAAKEKSETQRFAARPSRLRRAA